LHPPHGRHVPGRDSTNVDYENYLRPIDEIQSAVKSLAKDYPSAAERAAVFPSGTYTLQLTRTDYSVFTVTLTQSALVYPAVPRFSNLLSMEIGAGQDLKLDWQTGSDATADDFVVLQASGLNPSSFETWEFQTAWPGQAGALRGLATTATVPGSLLKPNDIITVVLTHFRVSDRQTTPDGLTLVGSSTAVSTVLSVPDQPQGGDVARYRLLSSRSLRQDDQSAPAASANGGFAFEASALAVAQDRLTNVLLGLPLGATLNLQPDGDHVLWQTNLVFDTEGQLLAAAPSGDYKWTFASLGAGTQTATTAAGAASAWPAPLTVVNWPDLQTNSFTKEVVVRWTEPPGALGSDLIEFIVSAPSGEVAYRDPDDAKGEQPLSGTDTQLTVRANTLIDGVDYEGRLRYLMQFFSLGDWNETGKASLARGMANAINRAEARCSENFAPGEFAVMIGRDRQALQLGLDQYAPEALDSEKVLDRVSRCLRFELKLESIIDVPGKWVEQVRSAQLRFRWDKKDISEGGIYLRPEGSANLDLVSWDFYKEKVRPVTGSGSFEGIWLKLSSDTQEEDSPPDEANPCLAPPASKPPSSVTAFFNVMDPINGMSVKDANGVWWLIDIPVGAGGRWASAFKEAHLQDWVGLPDLDGNEMTGFRFENWEVEGGEVFATREFTGPIETSQGRATEITYLELRHVPQPSTTP
jgi:hypothetical protein